MPYRPPPEADILGVEPRPSAEQRGLSNRSQPLGRSHANRQGSRGFCAGDPLAACKAVSIPFYGEELPEHAYLRSRSCCAPPAWQRRSRACDCPAGTGSRALEQNYCGTVSSRSTVARPAVKGRPLLGRLPPRSAKASQTHKGLAPGAEATAHLQRVAEQAQDVGCCSAVGRAAPPPPLGGLLA